MDKKKLSAKAGLAFLCCISCCAFANYITYEVIKSSSEDGLFANWWFFMVYVIQVVAALMAAVYGDILLKRGRLLKDWHSTKELPDVVCGKKKPDVKGDTDLDDYDYGENEEPEKDDEEGED